MAHRRANVRRLGRGDPVYLCFCNLVNHRQYKLGFDRQFFVRSVRTEEERGYETALEAQAAALATIKPGARAEDPACAAADVYRLYGYAPAYRTGRGIGLSNIEQPELKVGDRTVLHPGMTFAVDGSVTVPDRCGIRISDSITVTENGFDDLIGYPKELLII